MHLLCLKIFRLQFEAIDLIFSAEQFSASREFHNIRNVPIFLTPPYAPAGPHRVCRLLPLKVRKARLLGLSAGNDCHSECRKR